MSKYADYAQLVAARKACHLCSGLTNPSDIDGGRFNAVTLRGNIARHSQQYRANRYEQSIATRLRQ